MLVLRLIGYWRSDEQPWWPNPRDFIDALWHDDERRVLIRFLLAGTTARVHRGWSDCRFCGEQNGDCDFTDGTHLWPQGLAHYVRVHGVRLPKEFVAHTVARIDTIEGAVDTIETVETDDSWWAAQRHP